MRIQRLNAWKIVEGFQGSKAMPAITQFYSLPYDDELLTQEKEEMNRVANESAELYRQAREAGYFNMTLN